KADAFNAGARHLERRVERPQGRREGVADAARSAAGDRIHLVYAELAPSWDPGHERRQPGGEPSARAIKQQVLDRRTIDVWTRVARPEQGIRVECQVLGARGAPHKRREVI